MANFQTSTHRSNWIFTPEQLVEKYNAANQRAIQILNEYGAALAKVDDDGSLSYPEVPQENSRPEVLSIEEEQLIRAYYESRLKEVCNIFYFPHKIQATALIYFKRFFLRWSVMQHEPKYILLSCIYAACKIEESYISAEQLANVDKQDPDMILKYELIVYQSLEFDLIVYTPYRSVEGLIHDMEESSCRLNDDDQIQMMKNSATMEVDKIMLTDAPLVFPPGQLALAALRRANEVHRFVEFDRYMGSILSCKGVAHTVSELVQCLDTIDTWVKRYEIPSYKKILKINRKLKSCWGQSLSDESKKSMQSTS